MAVPKKRISKSKKRIRKNIWKKKRLTLKLKNLFRKKKDMLGISFFKFFKGKSKSFLYGKPKKKPVGFFR